MKSAESPVSSVDGLERGTQELVAPPFLPEHTQIAIGDPKVVKIRLDVQEKEMQIERGLTAHTNRRLSRLQGV
jgi:nitrite reductase (NO-forming)